jgi:hypothetical protein
MKYPRIVESRMGTQTFCASDYVAKYLSFTSKNYRRTLADKWKTHFEME